MPATTLCFPPSLPVKRHMVDGAITWRGPTATRRLHPPPSPLYDARPHIDTSPLPQVCALALLEMVAAARSGRALSAAPLRGAALPLAACRGGR